MRKLSRRSVAVGVVLSAALGLGAGAAHAANITATITPYATAGTQTVNGIQRARVRVSDTAADNRRAVAEFRRGSAAGALLSVSANGGNGSVAYSATGTRIHEPRVGAVNNNPLHGNVWSGWSR